MNLLREVALDVVGLGDETVGQLWITLLPGTSVDPVIPPILDLRRVPERDETLEPVQLLESVEYRYGLLVFLALEKSG